MIASLLFNPQVWAFESSKGISLSSAQNPLGSLGLSIIPKHSELSTQELKTILEEEAPDMRAEVRNKVLTIFQCARKQKLNFRPVLTVIDYSSPANKKRLWTFDLEKRDLLHHSHVSHGIKSGETDTSYFSNVNNSKASSIGVYLTGDAYHGRYGRSMKLKGLEKDFNSNAYNRFIVLHGSWYVNEDFIEKYGRPGRSWGCPSVPRDKVNPIVDSIKNDSLLIAYYPGEQWLLESKFLQCDNRTTLIDKTDRKKIQPIEENRSDILFTDNNNNKRWENNEPVLVMQASEYKATFKKPVPLKRMLRRPVNKQEFVALTGEDLIFIVKNKPGLLTNKALKNNTILFVVPEVKKLRGYWATEMKIIHPGEITEVTQEEHKESDGKEQIRFKLHLKHGKTLQVVASDQFIRWLGL